MTRTIDQAIEEKLCSRLRGFVAFPDDVAEFVMPLVREAVEEWQNESMRRATLTPTPETEAR